jgi:hypothetical protein
LVAAAVVTARTWWRCIGDDRRVRFRLRLRLDREVVMLMIRGNLPIRSRNAEVVRALGLGLNGTSV